MLTISGFSLIEGISKITDEAAVRSGIGVISIPQGIIVAQPNG